MKSGYKIVWTEHALEELSLTVEYIRSNFSDREVGSLADKIESVLRGISKFPKLYPESFHRPGVRRAVVATMNTLYYRVNDITLQIEILSFFSNRENPEKLEL
jgi:plasmid stabilization system protein ParE